MSSGISESRQPRPARGSPPAEQALSPGVEPRPSGLPGPALAQRRQQVAGPSAHQGAAVPAALPGAGVRRSLQEWRRGESRRRKRRGDPPGHHSGDDAWSSTVALLPAISVKVTSNGRSPAEMRCWPVHPHREEGMWRRLGRSPERQQQLRRLRDRLRDRPDMSGRQVRALISSVPAFADAHRAPLHSPVAERHPVLPHHLGPEERAAADETHRSGGCTRALVFL